MATYAWADIHGCWDCFKEGLKYLTPEDKIYFLGDAADRGPDGWKIIKAIINDERFTYIKGNHEDLMIKAIGNFQSSNADWFWDQDIELWYWNGGRSTHIAFTEDTICDAEKRLYLFALKNLPFLVVYNNKQGQKIYLSHAGYDDFDTGDEKDFIWDRSHFMSYDTWDGEFDEFIVHGHTPIELMINNQKKNARRCNIVDPDSWKGYGAYGYCKGHKINIDTGAVWNGNSVLLNLDTWEETIFTFTPALL